VHIPIIDVPAFLGGVSRSATGELGHVALKCGLGARALISGPVVFRWRSTSPDPVTSAVAHALRRG
jgi:hypothetical protein